MATLSLETYRKKGINAYLVGVDADIASADYGQPLTEADEQKAHQSKAYTVSVDLSGKADGLYRFKEASGHKTAYGYLLIQNGEIAEEFESESDARKFVQSASDPLPELFGSEKQIIWAESLRSKFVASIGDAITDWSAGSAAHDGLDRIKSAKVWIDNRDKLNPAKFIEAVRKVEAERAKVEAQIELEDKIQLELADHLECPESGKLGMTIGNDT